MKRVAIIGAGGHARVVLDILQAMQAGGSSLGFAGFIDTRPGVGVIGSDDDLPRLKAAGTVDAFIVGIGSVRGGERLRQRVYERALEAGLDAFTACHPRAILADGVSLETGAAVMAGAILNPGVRVAQNAIINTGAIVDHDGQIHAHAHIAPGVVTSGDVTVGERTLVGTGACVRQGISIGADATVGAGAVVVSDVASGSVVAGNPARTLS